MEDLHQRWGRANVTPNSENIKAQADNEAKVTKRFIRIIQRKDLPWERDSIARAANDPEHIPDCNVKATVGQHFLFHEPIPKAINGQGYLRVTTKSLWWQHTQFPKVWTAEGLSTCSENGYQWTVNSTTLFRRGIIFEYSGRDSRRRRQSNRPLRKPRLRLKQKRSACRRRRQSNSPLRKPSERRRRNASGRSL